MRLTLDAVVRVRLDKNTKKISPLLASAVVRALVCVADDWQVLGTRGRRRGS